MSPGRIRLEDLPPEVAAKIAGRTGRARRVQGSGPKRDRSTRSQWRCPDCGAMFTAYAPAEAHSDSRKHRRIELVW
jgi:hypothetical protein